MNIQEYIKNMQIIYQNVLDFLEEDQDEEEKYENLFKFLTDQQISKNRYILKTFLYILAKISNNHYRCPNFFAKIEKILQSFKKEIKNYYTNLEIFQIFKNNKRLLLFLFQESIIVVDETISSIILSPKYQSRDYFNYLFSENYEKFGFKQKLDENFHELRKIGENDDLICRIIRQDLIEDFIIYVNKNDYSLKCFIKRSIYETNIFLLKQKKMTLIEYAAFFGSVQIFKYLYKNGIMLYPNLWLYAIHGNDSEIISILEENSILPPNFQFNQCIKESIKCHHNNIVDYIRNNHMNDDDFENNNNENFINCYCFHYYNLNFFPKEIDNEKYFFNCACKFDYFLIVEHFLNNGMIDMKLNI